MDLTGFKTIWQISAGDTNRNYSDVAVHWDVMLNGNGEVGAWPESRIGLKEIGVTAKKISDIERFCSTAMVKPGDLILLRLGTRYVAAVGIVADVNDSYAWYDDFGDIDGWDLQHVRRVKWVWHDSKCPKAFDPYSLKMGDTCQKLNLRASSELEKWLLGLSPTLPNLDLATLPSSCIPGERITQPTLGELSNSLQNLGCEQEQAEIICKAISEIRRLWENFTKYKIAPSESETVTHGVIPLLLALGWPREKIALEWHNIDVTLFREVGDRAGSFTAIEAKRAGTSCLSARSQAESYANKDNEKCERIVVTDGVRYGIFLKGNNSFQEYPNFYFNLQRFVENYPILAIRKGGECRGITAGLMNLIHRS